MSASTHFSETYIEARDKFRAALAASGGRLRESVRLQPAPGQPADGYDTLVVMSLLDREYQARVALALEGA